MNLLEMKQIVSEISYKDWDIIVSNEEFPYLQCKWKDGNNPQHGRKWQLSKHMTKSELVQTALKAVLAAEEHEAREQFIYCGAAIFGPHFNVDFLVEVCREAKLDVRVG